MCKSLWLEKRVWDILTDCVWSSAIISNNVGNLPISIIPNEVADYEWLNNELFFTCHCPKLIFAHDFHSIQRNSSHFMWEFILNTWCQWNVQMNLIFIPMKSRLFSLNFQLGIETLELNSHSFVAHFRLFKIYIWCMPKTPNILFAKFLFNVELSKCIRLLKIVLFSFAIFIVFVSHKWCGNERETFLEMIKCVIYWQWERMCARVCARFVR